jgi:hypothetical protein
MALLDPFKKGKITIKYKQETSDTDANVTVDKSIVLNLDGIRLVYLKIQIYLHRMPMLQMMPILIKLMAMKNYL